MKLDVSKGEPGPSRLRGRRWDWLLFSLLAGGHATTLSGLAKFTLGPARLELRLAPGAETTAVIDAVNHGEEALRLKAYAFDFDMDSDGGIHYGRTLAAERSCASWFRFNPQVLELTKAGDSEAVRATARVPSGASGTYWCVLFLEDIPPPVKPGSRAIAARFNARVGSIVYIDVGSPSVPALRVETMGSVPGSAPEAGGLEVAADIVHESGGYLRPKAHWELVSPTGDVIAREEAGFPLLPGHRWRLRWVIHQAPGRYTVRLSLDYGGPRLLVAEAPVTVAAPTPARSRS